MNLILYFFTGFLVAIIGALPLGTVNVAVINTTIKENISSALKIVFPAAIGELFLIFFAICYFKTIQNFISVNSWLEYLIVLVLLVLGSVLVFGKKNCIKDEQGECIVTKKSFQFPKEAIGFLLGLFNPTVLVYWLLAISFLSTKMIQLHLDTAISLLILFFLGAFVGKSLTLYGYGKCSNLLKMRIKGITATINKIIGSLLLIAGVIQLLKLIY